MNHHHWFLVLSEVVGAREIIAVVVLEAAAMFCRLIKCSGVVVVVVSVEFTASRPDVGRFVRVSLLLFLLGWAIIDFAPISCFVEIASSSLSSFVCPPARNKPFGTQIRAIVVVIDHLRDDAAPIRLSRDVIESDLG